MNLFFWPNWFVFWSDERFEEIVESDIVPRDLHVPNATIQRCRSNWDFAFKQKNCSPGIIKSKRRGSCEWAKSIRFYWWFNLFWLKQKNQILFNSQANTKHDALQPSWINSLDL